MIMLRSNETMNICCFPSRMSHIFDFQKPEIKHEVASCMLIKCVEELTASG